MRTHSTNMDEFNHFGRMEKELENLFYVFPWNGVLADVLPRCKIIISVKILKVFCILTIKNHCYPRFKITFSRCVQPLRKLLYITQDVRLHKYFYINKFKRTMYYISIS